MTNAQKCGAKAILIYNDPQDSAPVPDEDLYPHGWWLPRSGVQRGSILLGTGDPLTPRYPSKGTAEMFWFDYFLLYDLRNVYCSNNRIGIPVKFDSQIM